MKIREIHTQLNVMCTSVILEIRLEWEGLLIQANCDHQKPGLGSAVRVMHQPPS